MSSDDVEDIVSAVAGRGRLVATVITSLAFSFTFCVFRNGSSTRSSGHAAPIADELVSGRDVADLAE